MTKDEIGHFQDVLKVLRDAQRMLFEGDHPQEARMLVYYSRLAIEEVLRDARLRDASVQSLTEETEYSAAG